jgi:hypothetical protein
MQIHKLLRMYSNVACAIVSIDKPLNILINGNFIVATNHTLVFPLSSTKVDDTMSPPARNKSYLGP